MDTMRMKLLFLGARREPPRKLNHASLSPLALGLQVTSQNNVPQAIFTAQNFNS